MDNPKYKFFLDEMTEAERPRYSNGEFIKSVWSSKEIEDQVQKIAEELFKRGYRIFGTGDIQHISFSKAEFTSSAYIGTFLNPYSTLDEIFWYSDKFVTSSKGIEIREVFRHNGVNANKSLDLYVFYNSGPIDVKYTEEKTFLDKTIKNKYGIERPQTYLYSDIIYKSYCCSPGKIRRFKPGISDRIMNKMIDKAEEILATYTINDMSKFEQNAADFPKDNTLEYRQYQRSKMGRN